MGDPSDRNAVVKPEALTSLAVVMEGPKALKLQSLPLSNPTDDDVVVEITHSSISTGTERLLWMGEMPTFPGMGYPLVPGYESVGVVRAAGERSGREAGERVFVPGANCYGAVRGLFGGASRRVVVPGKRVVSCPQQLGPEAVLLALAATAFHAAPFAIPGVATVDPVASRMPELIVGHGVLGRLLARLVVASGAEAPTVWDTHPGRRDAGGLYRVIDPTEDDRRDYACICDCSGDASLIDALVQRLRPGGEIILAAFYSAPIAFAFAPAFMREARFRIAAQWIARDLAAVTQLVEAGRLSLDGVITHTLPATSALEAYATAFGDSGCLKMVLDWSDVA